MSPEVLLGTWPLVTWSFWAWLLGYLALGSLVRVGRLMLRFCGLCVGAIFVGGVGLSICCARCLLWCSFAMVLSVLWGPVRWGGFCVGFWVVYLLREVSAVV
jgi:hypothetical protein